VRSNDAIVELLLIINSCKLASAESVTVITPFYPYSKVRGKKNKSAKK
jgi:ribose-phosphate pyrophosphokinase